MKSKFQILIFIFILIFSKCGNTDFQSTNSNYNQIPQTIKEIAFYKNNRDITQLSKYLNHNNPNIRKYAILSIASIGFPNSIDLLKPFLNDKDENVRIATAYALGLLKNSDAETFLITRFNEENSLIVKKQILEAIGFCGTEYGLKFLCSISSDNQIINEGIAFGLIRFAQRKIISEQSINKAIELALKSEPYSTLRQIISFFFTVDYDFSKYNSQLISIFKSSQNPIVKANLILPIAKSRTQESYQIVKNILFNSEDPVLLINAIKAAQFLSYEQFKKPIYNLLYSSDISVSKTAADFFIKKGKTSDINLFLKASKEVLDWETRIKITYAALKFSSKKQEIVNSLISGFEATNNIYEKAQILISLSEYPPAYKFVNDVLDTTFNPILKTSAVHSLLLMFENPKFDFYAQKLISENGDNLYNEFFLIFKNLISNSNDNAITFYSAKFFSNPKIINFINENFENTYFLQNPLNFIKLPRDFSAYQQLCIALKKVNNITCKTSFQIKGSDVNWNFLENEPQNLYLKIITSRGNIIIKLNSSNAIMNTANLLNWIKKGFYENKFISQSIPNQAVFFGGKRGDGWESEQFAYINDLYPTHFEEGSFALKNLGKNFTSSLWFITTYPTIFWDGKYTILGKVIKGMEVVRKLSPNDKIFSIEILDNPDLLPQ